MAAPASDMTTDISTHALREEGDVVLVRAAYHPHHFYPRPPRGGRHVNPGWVIIEGPISTHALREEGDTT